MEKKKNSKKDNEKIWKESGQKGGQKTKELYGTQHFKLAAREGWKKRRNKETLDKVDKLV